MVFSSLFFLFVFLPLVLAFYYLLPRQYRNIVLLISSLFFYAWGEPVYIVLMLFCIAVNYGFGLYIERLRGKRRGQKVLLLSLLVNLLLLGFFKYRGFLLQGLNTLPGLSLNNPNLPLPIGISFYTFQALSYLIDVYRGNIPAEPSLVNFGTYIALFPQLIAGPILRYEVIREQLLHRRESFTRFGNGAKRFVIGLGKKVLLANNIGLLWSEIQRTPPPALPVLTAWMGLIAFALQIYFDFSGYSDMALGLGGMFGFAFPENFRYPYLSGSITEFWRRWHISLGSWFKEYVYLPLGGSRSGRGALYRNLLIVWLLTGLWHGASWNFALWGLYNGLFIALEKTFLMQYLDRAPRLLRHLYALGVILPGWVLFSFDSLPAGIGYLQSLCGVGGNSFLDQRTLYYGCTWVILLTGASCGATPLGNNIRDVLRNKTTIIYNPAAILFCLGVLFLSTSYLVNAGYNPFLYFRF